MTDKIAIDNDDYGEEYNPTDSEDNYSDEEREILQQVRKGRERFGQGDTKEVLAFADSSDENDDDDEDDVNELMHDSDIEGADGDDDDDIPDAKDWGSKSRNYYHTDFVDQDYSTYNEQEEEMAQQEEEEAKLIQQRLAKQMKEEDFLLDEFNEIGTTSVSKYPAESQKAFKTADSTLIKKDFSSLNKRQKQQLFQKDSPEFQGLVNDFETYYSEVEMLLTPVMQYVKENNVPIIPALDFARTYQNMLLNYCTNISFYLLLKAKRVAIKNHPITKRLVQLKKLLGQLKDKYENIIKPQLEALLERIVDNDQFEVLAEKSVRVSSQKKKSKKLAILDKYDEASGSEDESILDAEANEQDDEDDDEARRPITYQIAKNKGLTPHRKKEQRNPRVKHRNKFRKAIIRRKGAVRTVRKETKRYGGEISGIKATVTKSVKFKS